MSSKFSRFVKACFCSLESNFCKLEVCRTHVIFLRYFDEVKVPIIQNYCRGSFHPIALERYERCRLFFASGGAGVVIKIATCLLKSFRFYLYP